MSELKPIVGYLTLTERGETKFVKGSDYPGTWVNREVLTCGHTYVTPTYEGKLSTAHARRCKKCASGKPEDIPQARILAWMQGETAGRVHYLLVVEDDTEPEIRGPYQTDAKRVAAAKQHRQRRAYRDGLFRLDVYASGIPDVDAFGGSEIAPGDEEQTEIVGDPSEPGHPLNARSSY
jgi:hypothetical protein